MVRKCILLTVAILVIAIFVPVNIFAEEDEQTTSGTFDGVDWRIEGGYPEQELIIGAEGEKQTFTYSDNDRKFPWGNWYLRSIRFEGEVAGNGNMNDMFAFSALFQGASVHDFYWAPLAGGTGLNLKEIDLTHFNTSRVTSMSGMFSGCVNVETIDLTGFDTSHVTDMSRMFEGCASLVDVNMAGLDTSRVTDMGLMFHRCYNLNELDLSGLDFSAVTNMSGMFSECGLTDFSLTGLNARQLKNAGSMFFACIYLKNLDLSNFKATNVEETENMFFMCNKLKQLNMSGFDIGNNTLYIGTYTDSYQSECSDFPNLKYIALGPNVKFTEDRRPTGWVRYKTFSGDDVGDPFLSSLSYYTGEYPGWYRFEPSKMNPMIVTYRNRTISAKKLKKGSKLVKAITVKKAKNKVRFTKKSGSRCLSVNRKNGRIKVKKGTKKGLYNIRIKVSASRSREYMDAEKSVYIKIRVR